MSSYYDRRSSPPRCVSVKYSECLAVSGILGGMIEDMIKDMIVAGTVATTEVQIGQDIAKTMVCSVIIGQSDIMV